MEIQSLVFIKEIQNVGRRRKAIMDGKLYMNS